VDKFSVEIRTSNAAFDDDPTPELERIIRGLADTIRDGRTAGILRDVNGNTVGEFGFSNDD